MCATLFLWYICNFIIIIKLAEAGSLVKLKGNRKLPFLLVLVMPVIACDWKRAVYLSINGPELGILEYTIKSYTYENIYIYSNAIDTTVEILE